MLRINTYKILHTNSYVVNQSYEFVFHLTSSLQPPNKKVRTFGKWCWWRSPNKATLLMLQNDTCELPHTNLYVYHQSYEFVLRNTKNYFPPEPKKLTQHHNCMVLQIHSSMYNQNPFPAKTKSWHNSTTGKKVPVQPKQSVGRFLQPTRSECICSSFCLSVCLSVRTKKVE